MRKWVKNLRNMKNSNNAKTSSDALTRVLFYLCIGGLVFGYLLPYFLTYFFSGVNFFTFIFQFFILVFASSLGLLQIIISIKRWKRLGISDKTKAIILLLPSLFFIIAELKFALNAFYYYQNPKIIKQAIEKSNPILCEKVKRVGLPFNNQGPTVSKDFCYLSIALKTQNAAFCKFMLSDMDCVEKVAISSGNPSVCEQSVLPYSCYDSVLNKIWNNIEDKDRQCDKIFFGTTMNCNSQYTGTWQQSYSDLQIGTISSEGGFCYNWYKKKRDALCPKKSNSPK